MTLKLGDWNAVCDVCGFEFKASQLRKRWDGQMVCSKDFETRHPQDLIRTIREHGGVAWARPEPTETFVSVPEPLLTESLLGLNPESSYDLYLMTEG